MAERWLKRLLPRFLSLKFWISWMWSEIGFSKSWSSICAWRGRTGRGVGVREQLMEQHFYVKGSTGADARFRQSLSAALHPPPRPLPVLSALHWNLQSSALARLPFPLPITPFPQTFLGSRGDPSVHVKAYGFSSVYTSPSQPCVHEHGVSFCHSFSGQHWTFCCRACSQLS